MESQEVTIEGSHQETVQIEEGDTVSRVVKRTVLHSEGDQREVSAIDGSITTVCTMYSPNSKDDLLCDLVVARCIFEACIYLVMKSSFAALESCVTFGTPNTKMHFTCNH